MEHEPNKFKLVNESSSSANETTEEEMNEEKEQEPERGFDDYKWKGEELSEEE